MANPNSIKNLKRGGSPGRPRGSPNKTTMALKTMAMSILDDPAYLANLRTALVTRSCHPLVEAALWKIAYGCAKRKTPFDADAIAEMAAALHRFKVRLEMGGVDSSSC